ncbi:hypothetical protein [Sphingobacterium faecale]|uniref:Uncharacterized protein n=1 Tax=Sphingobacterium faecale TaxID=2803775 RepID=A0ABS1R8Z1_9SPHI|nr:hypothetical protein [Sphingobacterium faecale]MBL1411000.1 hypothetical protein [Sphingobacterium faecale]
MDYEVNTWVWVWPSAKRKLAFVLAVREHTVMVRYYDVIGHRLSASREVWSKRVVVPAHLEWEQLEKLPCGKRPLALNRAKMIVATNMIFTDNEKRLERRVYYCRRCRAFHTTAQFKLPVAFLKTLALNPYQADGVECYKKIGHRKRVWYWWHHTLGVKIPFGLFERIIAEYAPTPETAILQTQLDPLAFMHYMMLYLYKARLKRMNPES